MKLVDFPQPTTMDIPRVLRSIANQLEKGELTASAALIVLENQDNKDTTSFGAGFVDYYRGMAILARAQIELIDKN